MPRRTKSSARWLAEHFSDEYVKRAQAEGWRSRAVFKLEEIQGKDRIIRPGMRVIDLGAAPGGWSQFAARVMQGKGTLLASDILPMDPLPGVDFVQGDFTEQAVFDRLTERLGGLPADLVMSDMAPNISGDQAIDQPRAMYLVELALDFAQRALGPEGAFLVKVFQGEGFPEFMKSLRGSFRSVVTRKPRSSRARSREVYLLARSPRKPAAGAGH
ncbi:MAG TPA: 23S rRNA (uridine(2552)-2'-O)-methyltransferase RlmE [Gammaproteobacteria bacterium]|nr:23S rRNA (uridine(2552)-2'-O)-methyltransferase RlmE [Gammaproteobacteria bacterium]